MIIESYERLRLDITRFDAEDIITTSGVPGGNKPEFTPDEYEMPVGF